MFLKQEKGKVFIPPKTLRKDFVPPPQIEVKSFNTSNPPAFSSTNLEKINEEPLSHNSPQRYNIPFLIYSEYCKVSQRHQA